MSNDEPDFKAIAREFATKLGAREYSSAHQMTSRGYRATTSLSKMRVAFEDFVDLEWGNVGPIEVGKTMTEWPDKQDADVGWVYINIGGESYNEALTVIVTMEDDVLRIREVEWGRP